MGRGAAVAPRHGGGSSSSRNQCVLRPDEGLDAVSVMAPGRLTSGISQVYSPMIQLMISELGYTGSGLGALRALPYDWRLSPRRLQGRDGYFAATKASLELAVQQNRRPAVVFAHSMGNLVFLYFLEWLRLVHFGHHKSNNKNKQFYKGVRGDAAWQRWIDDHVWCYVACRRRC